jgi:histidinol-phosphate aminotransferase
MAMLKVRDAIAKMGSYRPPVSGRSGLRLDFNENTSGCSPRVLAKLRTLTPEALTIYPDRGPSERIMAQFLGISSDEVLLTNGVDEAIHLICEAYLDDQSEVLIATPTFGMYEVYAQQTGAAVVRIQADQDFSFPTQRLLNAISPRTRVVLIANPNNPTGTAASEADLISILKAAPHAAVLLDEAYFEFYGRTLLPRLREFQNLFIARTFSKAYGLAGLRVGALCGSKEQLAYIRKIVTAYNVNVAALFCLPEALADAAFVTAYVSQVKEGRDSLCKALDQSGVKFWPSEANFVLLYIGEKSGSFVKKMREQDILVRDRSSDPGCAGCVRITLGTESQTKLLLDVLPKVLMAIGWSVSSEATA